MSSLVEVRRGVDEFINALELRAKQIDQREREIQQLCEETLHERELLEREREELGRERHGLEEEKRKMAAENARKSEIITLNIGGERIVQRRRSTLCAVEDSFLAARFSGRWEQEVDLDDDGRYFINFAPEVFMPLLDYLGMKEIEDPLQPIPPPRGPEHTQDQFARMLNFFGIPAAKPAEPTTSLLSVTQISYADTSCSSDDFVFELRVKQRPVSIVALELAGASTESQECSVTMCEGSLDISLGNPEMWRVVGTGILDFHTGSWVQFTHPVHLIADMTYCIKLTGPCALGDPLQEYEASAQDEHLEVFTGYILNSLLHWAQFVGRIEYSVLT